MDWWREQAKRGMNGRTYVLLGLLAATLFWIQSLDEREKALRERARAAGGPPPPSVAAIATPGKTEPSTPTAEGWGRDPFDQRFGKGPLDEAFARRSPARAAPIGLVLQGVMNGPSGRTALINGEIYREGERVGSREVLQIGTRSVLLLDDGTVTTLTLKGDGS
ncbi:MAG TPA: hypothetical protein VF363_07180 [Candidatus Eisenbacteria bacterium]